MVRHFLDICDVSTDVLRGILAWADRLKQEWKEDGGRAQREMLAGKVLAMILARPSTRTQVSFSVAMAHLGGYALVLPRDRLQLGRGETLSDTARVMSRFVDCLVLRTAAHTDLSELACHADIPVINGLTDFSHPCQVMADVMTFEEHVGPIGGRTVAWVGDGNNMVHSWLHAAARLDFTLRIACPASHRPDRGVVEWAREEKASVDLCDTAMEAVRGADCVITDTWVSMGDTDAVQRRETFRGYSVDESLMDLASPEAIFMHCLPAHRGEEVSSAVIDGPRSLVFDEAENRLHVQKAILAWCILGMGA